MKKSIRNFAAWLFVSCGGDDASLGRLTMSTITARPRDHTKDRKPVIAKLAAIHDSSEFQDVLSELIHDQKEFIALKATTESLYPSRATMNGIMLVRDHFKRAKDEHEASLKTRGEFDPHAAI